MSLIRLDDRMRTAHLRACLIAVLLSGTVLIHHAGPMMPMGAGAGGMSAAPTSEHHIEKPLPPVPSQMSMFLCLAVIEGLLLALVLMGFMGFRHRLLTRLRGLTDRSLERVWAAPARAGPRLTVVQRL